MQDPMPFIPHIVVEMPKDSRKLEFINWYNKKYNIYPKMSGNSSCYLIPYVRGKCSGRRCGDWYPNASRITFEQWKQQYCPEIYQIY